MAWDDREKGDRLRETMFLVEASTYEQLTLWEKYHKECGMEQINPGIITKIGEVASRPVVIHLQWMKVHQQPVLFYHPTSEVVDWKMIDQWLKENTDVPRWDNGTRNPRTDAMNFYHCVSAMKDRSQTVGGKP